jgi:hypothetical protein
MRYLVAALIAALIPLHAFAQTQTASPTSGGPVGRNELFGADLGPGIDINGIAAMGSAWVRIPADWAALEPTRGKFAWGPLDAAVKHATDARLSVVVVFLHTPKWAALTADAPEEVWLRQPPRDLKDWQAFVAAVGKRYHGRIAAWQVLPSLHFSAFRGTGQDYFDMLHAARVAIRGADPQALVVAAAPAGLDLAYVKMLLTRAASEFDALVMVPNGRPPESVLEALGVIRARILRDTRYQVWLTGADPIPSAVSPRDEEVGDQMARSAVVAAAGGVTREFWGGRWLSAKWASQRETLQRMLNGVRYVGWLSRGPGVYAIVFTDGRQLLLAVWSTSGSVNIPLDSDGTLKVTAASGASSPAVTRDGKPGILAGPEPLFVQGLAPSVSAEAEQNAKQAAFPTPRDPAQDFSHADEVSVALAGVNTEHGLYNQRFRALQSGGVVPVTVDSVNAVRTDQRKDAVYVYLDVDHSFAYFVDGQADLRVTIEVHRARAAQQLGLNLLYDSMSGYRFTPWQWIDAGSGWETVTIRITDASFTSAWGWDFAINGAGNKKEDLVVRSVSVHKVAPGSP